ncbi:zinc ribbon domain-containing protein [Chloroflexota bacterium]
MKMRNKEFAAEGAKISFILLALLAAAVFALAPVPPMAYAETADGITLENVRLWLNPEYDDPRLLVMLEGQIAGFSAPVELSFLVPSAAEMYSAGSKDSHGVYTGGPPDRELADIPGWDRITYTVTNQTFRVEYYDPIIIGQTDKTISYDFYHLYAITQLEVIAQEPRGTSNYTVTPKGTTRINGEGLTEHISSFYNLDSASPRHFEIAYTKSGSGLSAGPVGNTEKTGNIAGRVALIVLTVAVVGGGIFWVLRSKKKPKPIKPRGTKNIPARFCTQCGNRTDANHKFCPYCGQKQK